MVQSTPQLISADEFINRYGDDNRYELIDGELIDMEPTGPHEQVAAFIPRSQAQPGNEISRLCLVVDTGARSEEIKKLLFDILFVMALN